MTQNSQKKESNSSSQDLKVTNQTISPEHQAIIDRINKSIEEDKDLTDDELQMKYNTLANAWD